MTQDLTSGDLPSIGQPIDYADGAEAELLQIMSEAVDRSSQSDELAEHVRDWPTAYHLSRLRSNLLRPLAIKSGARVLDVGAGTGAITRYLGEVGANVTAVEGSRDRALVARERCQDLPNVQVVSGDVMSLEIEQPFDLVVVVGVLEYASAPANGPNAASGFIQRLKGLMAADGALVLAIENQLGLKYLLGLPEDHLGVRGIGVTGYHGGSHARTFSRKALRDLLASVGLGEQKWLYPFPDYKRPNLILSESLYEWPDPGKLVDQLVREPVVSNETDDRPDLDARRSHMTFVEGGLGPDVANSFLVVAGSVRHTVDMLVADEELCWMYGDERRSRWLRSRTLVKEGSDLRLDTTSGESEVDGWLAQYVGKTSEFVRGKTAERIALDAVNDGQLEALHDVLNRWLAQLRTKAEPHTRAEELHPFSPIEGEEAIAPNLLDANLDNFIAGSDARELAYIDAEWAAPSPISLSLVVYRAVWYLALRIARSGSQRIWPNEVLVGNLATELFRACGLDGDDRLHRRFVEAEAHFQAKVRANSRRDLEKHLEDLTKSTLASLGPVDPWASLSMLGSELEHRQRVIDDLAVEAEHRLTIINDLAAEAEHRLTVINDLAAEAEHRQQIIDELASEAEDRRRMLEQTSMERDGLAHELNRLRQAIDRSRMGRLFIRESSD